METGGIAPDQPLQIWGPGHHTSQERSDPFVCEKLRKPRKRFVAPRLLEKGCDIVPASSCRIIQRSNR
jgi:hypothetical protein